MFYRFHVSALMQCLIKCESFWCNCLFLLFLKIKGRVRVKTLKRKVPHFVFQLIVSHSLHPLKAEQIYNPVFKKFPQQTAFSENGFRKYSLGLAVMSTTELWLFSMHWGPKNHSQYWFSAFSCMHRNFLSFLMILCNADNEVQKLSSNIQWKNFLLKLFRYC